MTTIDVDARVQRATDFFEAQHNLAGQRSWYSNKAAKYKSWHGRLGFVVLAAGAATSLIQVVATNAPKEYAKWFAIVTAGFGVLVILAKGADQIWHFGEHWISYRRASEAMKHERRVYVNGAGEYAALADEDVAFRRFVDQIEEVIATEQRAFWKRAGEKEPTEKPAPKPAPEKPAPKPATEEQVPDPADDETPPDPATDETPPDPATDETPPDPTT